MSEPTKLGRYVIEGTLGRGAMGVVYLARDPVIGRALALKTLKVPDDSEDQDEFRARFLREAQAAGMLNHPGIVTIHDAGVDDASGLSFIVMEYIEGRSLKDLLKGGNMFAYSEVARIAASLAGALDYAHSKGVVHRDIKPANIILTPQGTVKITDFGVARLESSNLTATGQFIGTPNYMSPEQVTGGAVDGRSDLFSLGVVLHELLTGARPFVGGSLTEVTYRIVHDPAPIPSQARAGLPPAFNPIVLKLLEKDPAKRYQKGAEVARALDALRRVLAGMTGEVTSYVEPQPKPQPAPEAVMQQAPTATRATSVEPGPEPKQEREASIWRLPIHPRWAGALITGVTLPPLLVIAVLALRIDSGPYPGPSNSEAHRRHRVADAQRMAALALAGDRPEETERLLEEVFDQAPHSMIARRLAVLASQEKSVLQERRRQDEQVGRLREEGQQEYQRGRLREAEARFAAVLRLAPEDEIARDYLELIRERLRFGRSSRPAPVVPTSPPAAQPTRVAGEARLELYFVSPLPAGTVEVDVDGTPIVVKPFSFYRKGAFGLRVKGTGVFSDDLRVRSGEHAISVRLKDEEGSLLGQQALRAEFVAGARYNLRIDMDGERATPRFSLNRR